jgi:PAS domain S-box-containing protein
MTCPKILIVDDLSINLDLLEAILTVALDVETVRAVNGSEALTVSETTDFALAILDVNMPEMSGFELAERLRNQERTRWLPIIFVTAMMNDQINITRGYDTGAVDYITKPLNQRILLSKVRVFLDLFQQRKELESEIERRVRVENELKEIQSKLEEIVEARTKELSNTNEKLLAEMQERRKIGEMLKISEAKYRSMIESMYEIAYITDEDFRLVYLNPAAIRKAGRDATGQRCYQVLHGLTQPCEWCAWEQILNGEHWRLNVKSPIDGRHYQVSCSPIHLVDGTLHRLSIYRDITEEKEAEERLRYAKQKAEEANQAKSEFLANISHELRTPLHHILSFARFGVKKIGSVPETRLLEFFQSIRESGDSLLALLNDLLDLSRLESGRMDYQMGLFDMGFVVEESLQESHQSATEKQLVIAWSPPEPPQKAKCDQRKIQQVIRKLLSNAIKYSPEGKTITVTVTGDRLTADDGVDRAAVRVAVSDQGIGIPEMELSTVFDKFSQSSRTKTGAGGTGLGLAICREIIRAHHGTIWAENNPTGGAVFSFVIPSDPLPAVSAT